ncbi:MAG: hypothetical protein Q8N88_04425 [Nanoarchaeota archaeon]|nr:hypothetical protein [Nanoarchaeota archaeon]
MIEHYISSHPDVFCLCTIIVVAILARVVYRLCCPKNKKGGKIDTSH